MKQDKPLVDAVENVVIAYGMGWDMDGVIEVLKAALATEKPQAMPEREVVKAIVGQNLTCRQALQFLLDRVTPPETAGRDDAGYPEYFNDADHALAWGIFEAEKALNTHPQPDEAIECVRTLRDALEKADCRECNEPYEDGCTIACAKHRGSKVDADTAITLANRFLAKGGN